VASKEAEVVLLEVYDTRQARTGIRNALRLGAQCSASDARFELLRAVVWSLSAGGSAVHIARALSIALPAWRLICERDEASEDDLRAELRNGLSSLVDSGDLIEAAGGRWSPAMTRMIRLELDAGNLLVGGAPLSALPVGGDDVQHHGPYRHVGRSETLKAALHEEPLPSWAGIPELSLHEWARELRESLDRSPYAPATHEQFQFYVPKSARPHAPQFKRWFDEPVASKGTLLARRSRLYGAREYRLVDVVRGRIAGACELPAGEARRLMYALDAESRNPVQARATQIGNGYTEFLLMSELPRPEQRVLAAVGTLEIPIDRPWERRWRFDRGTDLALRHLTALEIEISSGREVRR
jgi:hypothetical protein